ncbi:hypothetical protein ILYODFUR_036627 [Ilyodon furcidens]|uniref:Uncharacterized protein n=1 Tax=Ilyodon furcidens TaxID=33524 RepID=A0ABV0TPV4_9TELE
MVFSIYFLLYIFLPSFSLTVAPYLTVFLLFSNHCFLIFSGLKFKNEDPSGVDSTVWDPPLELGLATEEVDAVDQIIIEGENVEPLDLQPQVKLPDQRKDLKVRVTHVNSPSSFYVRLTNSDSQLKR